MEPHFTSSPRWSPTTKLLVGLVVVGIIAFLFIRFTSLITPLLMVFILAYLLHPMATMISLLAAGFVEGCRQHPLLHYPHPRHGLAYPGRGWVWWDRYKA